MKLVALLAVALAGCRKSAPPPTYEARQVLEEFKMTQTHLGRPAWTLGARTAILKEDSKQALLSEPRMEFITNGKPTSRVRAASGLLHTDTHDLQLSTSVVVESLEDHSILKTEELLYCDAKKLFETQAEIELTRPGGVLKGRGLKAKPDLSEIRIFNQRSVITGEELKR